MKKIIISILVFSIILLNINTEAKKEEERAIFISYIELGKYIDLNNVEKSKDNIDKMITNISNLKMNTIILQVRSNQDAIYKSEIFRAPIYLDKEENKITFDILEYFIEKTHKKNMKLYAWINPYRVRTTSNIETITKNNPVYKYIGTDKIYVENGIYLNPSKQETLDLIIKGVKEVLNYKVDKILFDDYFYPSDEIDKKDYENYVNKFGFIEENIYRLSVVNNMMEKVHKICNEKNIEFGVSPDGNIENNYEKHHADIKKWLSSDNYVDFIMPQIYYGFYNSTKGYYKVAKEWDNLIKNNKIKLNIALAFYKVGTEDKYAKNGKYEWLQNDNIIMREVIISRNLNHYQGFSLFRYDNIFDPSLYSNMTIGEIENLKKIVK